MVNRKVRDRVAPFFKNRLATTHHQEKWSGADLPAKSSGLPSFGMLHGPELVSCAIVLTFMLSYLSYLLALRLSSYIQVRLNDRRRHCQAIVSARPISKPVSSFTACRTRRLNKKEMNVSWSKYYQQRSFVCDGVFRYSTRRVVLANKRNQAQKNKRNQAQDNRFNQKIAARIISSTISSKIAEIRKKRMDHLCKELRFKVAAKNICSTILSKVAEIRKKRMDYLCNDLRFKIAAKQIRSTIASKAAETRKKRMQHICSDLRFKIAAKHIRATIALKATITTASKVINSTTSNLKRVQFAQDNQVHEIMHFSEYTAQEWGGSWYSQQDFRRMRRDWEDENWEKMIAQMKKRKVDAIAVFQDDRGAFKKRKIQTADEEVTVVCLPPPCPVWIDTHPASAAAHSSQEVIVPDDSIDDEDVMFDINVGEEADVEEQEEQEVEEEVEEEMPKRATSPPLRRSQRIRERGLGSGFTGSGRRYSKRLAKKE